MKDQKYFCFSTTYLGFSHKRILVDLSTPGLSSPIHTPSFPQILPHSLSTPVVVPVSNYNRLSDKQKQFMLTLSLPYESPLWRLTKLKVPIKSKLLLFARHVQGPAGPKLTKYYPRGFMRRA